MKLWYHTPAEKIFKDLETSEKGLSKKEAASRLKRYGFNEIEEVDVVKWWHILLAQFTNIMVIILIIAMVVSALLGEYIDAIAIGVIIIINAVIGFIQEYKAEKAIDALKDMTAPHAVVIREGETLKIEARKLVPGDILVLEEGMHISADARIIKSAQLRTLEASLTGESHPTPKNTNLISKFDSIGDLNNMVFLGTTISQGHGLAVVVETGMKTEFGKIAHLVQTEKGGPTPLQQKLDHLSKLLAIIVVSVAALLFLSALITGRNPVEMFILSISLAVSVIPEGLPAVITLTLAIGVQRIAKKKAIIRKLPAAETLGSTSVICSDKTGTLTENQMTVQVLYINDENFQITGAGYSPKGEFMRGKKSFDPKRNKTIKELLTCASLCNNAKLIQEGKQWNIVGDPTEGCLLTLATKAKLDPLKLEEEFPRKDELVFDSKRKRMSTVNDSFMYTKGAPDSILKICTHIQVNGRIQKLTKKKRKEIMKINDDYAKQAYRILGFAYKKMKAKEKPKEEKMIFLGMVGMIDPPREEVKKAIKTCESAHIHVIMITGDHALTAKAIGKEIGLFQEGDKIMTGAELAQISDHKLKEIVEEVRIFARVNPEHKVKILKALKSHGHIVSMTGDGVNDAPALKSADIGIAMGITGTDVAKEASEMVLMDDNFATIVATVESGRVIYRNIKKFIRFLLSANFDEVLVITIVFLLGYPIPFLPLQILWVNLLTDALPAVALGSDVPDDDIMKLKPRNPKSNIWNEILGFSIIAGVISTVISLIVYFKFVETSSIEHTRTLMFTTIVIFELLLVFSVRSANKHYFTHFLKNKFLLLGVLISLLFQFLAIYNSTMQSILKTVPLSLDDWLIIAGLCAAGVALIEIWKLFRPKPTHV